jgi:hypothetical protein
MMCNAKLPGAVRIKAAEAVFNRRRAAGRLLIGRCVMERLT